MDDLRLVLDRLRPHVDYCSLRYVQSESESLFVRNGMVLPPSLTRDEGVMVSVVHGGGYGYAATSDPSMEGIYHALTIARDWAERCDGRLIIDPELLIPAVNQGEYSSRVEQVWDSRSMREKQDALTELDAGLQLSSDSRFERGESRAAVACSRSTTHLLDTRGTDVFQEFHRIYPSLDVTIRLDGLSQTRSLRRGQAFQAGLELLDTWRLDQIPERLVSEACQIVVADPCPTETMDLVLGPGQMILQVHESIGHPLELDRILGDERNYAGGSFVKPGDFGSLRYGSAMLNVVFEPGREGQVASYAFDDDGTPARREYLIRDGILERGIGGALSAHRGEVPGVASSRSSGWNRPPVDRMANINLLPGADSFDELIAGVEDGIFMDENHSWSIDDQRHKFQFGCEIGRRIRGGELAEWVRAPSYRGTTPIFWNSLDGVGDASTELVLGTPMCGKGEPNQLNNAGHAVPACRFRSVEVFGPH